MYTSIRTFILASLLLCAVCSMAQQTQADRYYQRADTLLLFNLHDSSERFFRLAADLFEQSQNWERYISSTNKISENQSAKFELKEALASANKALDLAEQHLSKNHLEKATAHINIGNVYYLTGQHEKALEEFNVALYITENTEDDELHLYSAPTNLGIGNVYYGKLQYEEAFRYFNNALITNSEILGNDHPYVANSYLSIGNLYRNKGSYNLAIENYEEALRINRGVFGENHPDIATTYVGLADIFKSSGEYEKALQYYNQALMIYTRFLDKRNPKYGAIYLGFADVAKNKGDYAAALSYYEKALGIFKNTVGDQHQSSVQSYLGIANTFIYQEKFLEALDYYGKVLDINFNLVGEDHVNTSAAYNNLGSLYYFAGDLKLAQTYFGKALKIDQNIHGRKHPNIANAYYNLARVSDEQGDTREALDNVQSAINSSIMDFNEGNIFVNPALVNFFDNRDLLWYLQFKGELLESGFSQSANMKGLDISLHSFILSDSLVDQIRKSYTDRRDQASLAEQAHQIYESAVNGSYNMLRLLTPDNVSDISSEATYAAKRNEYVNSYFYFTEKNKGSILFSSLAESNAKSFGDIPDSLVSLELTLKKQINQYTQELAANTDSAQQVVYQAMLFEANNAYEALVQHMESEYPKYYELKYDLDVVEIADLQDFLEAGTTMVSYFISHDYLYANYITKDTFEIHRTAKSDHYEKDIKALRNSILYRSDAAYAQIAQRMYQQLFPAALPEGTESMIIVLDGIMSVVPFEALLTETVDDAHDHQHMPYLVNSYDVSYTFSANLLYKTFRNEKTMREKARKTGILIAPVQFDAPYMDALRIAKAESYAEAGVAKALQKRAKPIATHGLPGTEEETTIADSLFAQAGKPTEMLIKAMASEHQFKASGLEDFQYVHLASHGFVDQEEPEFSGVLLGSDEAAGEDGILFSGEVYNLSLNAELVTLSACETALGKLSRGEGVIGLSRALIYAGGKNINVSLWPVADHSTQELMVDFYAAVAPREVPGELTQSLSYAKDLSAAKRQMIARGEYAHPYYWSPFVLLGK